MAGVVSDSALIVRALWRYAEGATTWK